MSCAIGARALLLVPLVLGVGLGTGLGVAEAHAQKPAPRPPVRNARVVLGGQIQPAEEASPDKPELAAPRLQPLADIESTRWVIHEAGRTMTVRFNEDGTVAVSGVGVRAPGATWVLESGVLTFSLRKGGPRYLGWQSSGGKLRGTVKHEGGKSEVIKHDDGASAWYARPAVRVADQPVPAKDEGEARRVRVVRLRDARPKAARGPDLIGTRWQLWSSIRAGKKEYQVELLAGGKLRSLNPQDSSPDNDEWERDGDVLRIFLNDRYATYEGCIFGGTRVEGAAINVRDTRWLFTMARVHEQDARPAAPDDDASPPRK